MGFALTVWRFFVASTLSSPFGVSLPLLRCPRLFPGCIFSDLHFRSGQSLLYQAADAFVTSEDEKKRTIT